MPSSVSNLMSMSGHSVIEAILATTGRFNLRTTGRAGDVSDGRGSVRHWVQQPVRSFFDKASFQPGRRQCKLTNELLGFTRLVIELADLPGHPTRLADLRPSRSSACYFRQPESRLSLRLRKIRPRRVGERTLSLRKVSTAAIPGTSPARREGRSPPRLPPEQRKDLHRGLRQAAVPLNTLLSRLDDMRTGAIVIVMQRIHLDDLTGFLLSLSDGWEVLSFPAIAEGDETVPLSGGHFHLRRAGEALSPEREPIEVLNNLKRQIGSERLLRSISANAGAPGGFMVKPAWIRRYHRSGIQRGLFHAFRSSRNTCSFAGRNRRVG